MVTGMAGTDDLAVPAMTTIRGIVETDAFPAGSPCSLSSILRNAGIHVIGPGDNPTFEIQELS